MKKIVIEGQNKLTGKIKIGGAKNSVVALIPAAILSDEIVTINNVPNISDVNPLIKLLKNLNAKINQEENNYTIDSRFMENKELSENLCNQLRASYYFMGALLSKYNRAEVYVPGGCVIGARPIDLHLKGFEKLGAKINWDQNKIIITADKLEGANIELPFASVGATINIMFAAVKANGVTTIQNAAKEPEINNVADFLNKMGAKINGAGTNIITIEGVEKLKSAQISVLPDRIEAGTYIIIGALLGNNLKIEGIVPSHLESLLSKLKEMGVDYNIEDNCIIISKSDNLKEINVKSLIYPGFPTDLGQPMQILLTQAKGISLFEETIFENRMSHTKYLNEMGANIVVDGQTAKIIGPTPLFGQLIKADDLRGGAALVLAGLIAKGTTTITNIDYILRGYENIIHKLTDVGANIRIEEI